MLSDLASQKNQDLVLGDKTLVAWVSLNNLDQRGSGILSLFKPNGVFDAIVYGEIQPRRWMSGSNYFLRTYKQQENWAEESAERQSRTFRLSLQIVIVYKGKEVAIYRNGQPYASYTMENDPVEFGGESIVLIGARLLDGGFFTGSIEDARIYDVALTAEQIATLKPNEMSDPQPLAWWNFTNGSIGDRMGAFGNVALIGNAQIIDGKLVLPESGSVMIATKADHPMTEQVNRWAKASVSKDVIDTVRQFRLNMLDDPYRPTYHFVVPEGYAMPFDPNGTIFWNGRYHLGYIYQVNNIHYWGHVSSTDLLHWRHHPPCLFPTPDSPEIGIFSGNCFINKNGEATMLYHGVGAGNCISTSADKNLDFWKKLPANPIIPNPPPGAPYASWDPHGWLEGDTYYAIFGGSKPAIFKAKELDKWEYVGDLLAHAVSGVDINEDISCPDLFKLGDKYVLVCISHRLGCRYYIGEWKNEQFYPEFHEQMSWVDNAFFAPESLEDEKGRRIMWAWLFDSNAILSRNTAGWSGTMSLPRVLSLNKDGKLMIKPIEELEQLRHNEQKFKGLVVNADTEIALENIQGNTIELLVEMNPDNAKQCGVKVCCSPNGDEQTLIYYDAEDKKLKIDTRNSGLWEGPKSIEAGPFELQADETLKLRIFIDKSVVEVFANDRQAVMRRIYPSQKDSVGVALFSSGGATKVMSVSSWDMMPSNPY
jgi:beta-fructofuranosidase